eukprot:1379105-Alexandrium_andersonii.AAC.1
MSPRPLTLRSPVSVPLPEGAPPVPVDSGPGVGGQGSHEPAPIDSSEPWWGDVPPRSLKGLESRFVRRGDGAWCLPD